MRVKIKNDYDVTIREAKVEDANEILRLIKQVMSEVEYFPSTTEEFNFTVEQEEDYINNVSLFLVAEVDGKIVGSTTLERGRYIKINHTATFGVTILNEYSGLGIGSLFMEEVINWSKENGIKKIDLEVFEENRPAIGLYKKYGFFIEGRKNRHIKINDKYQDMLMMTKLLTDI